MNRREIGWILWGVGLIGETFSGIFNIDFFYLFAIICFFGLGILFGTEKF